MLTHHSGHIPQQTPKTLSLPGGHSSTSSTPQEGPFTFKTHVKLNTSGLGGNVVNTLTCVGCVCVGCVHRKSVSVTQCLIFLCNISSVDSGVKLTLYVLNEHSLV